MKGITVRAGIGGSARLEEVPEPHPAEGAVLVETIAVGVCGTDRDILQGEYGEAPPGRDRLVIGHESLGRVIDAPADSGLTPGDLVAGIVRRPDRHLIRHTRPDRRRGRPEQRSGAREQRGIRDRERQSPALRAAADVSALTRRGSTE